MIRTRHFDERAQQRGISPAMIQMILAEGQFNARGDLVLLGKKDIDRIQQSLKSLSRDLDKMRSSGGGGITYDGGMLITTFHRLKKFKRN